MESCVWQLVEKKASLRLTGLSATVDLMRPTDGLTILHPCLSPTLETHVLGLEGVTLERVTAPSLVEHYARGADLIAAYAESQAWPVRVDARWQAVGTGNAPGVVGTIDLIVSVRTDRLDSQPAMAVVSRLPPGDVLVLANAPTSQFPPLKRGQPTLPERAGHPRCFLVRPNASPWSYAEMAHPADCHRSELSDPAGGSALRIRHHLFPEELEKGVILRARIRGALLARDCDAQAASACFTAMASADPPLGA